MIETPKALSGEFLLLLDGQLIPESDARLSPLEPMVLQGSGLFETMLGVHGSIPYLSIHLSRMQEGLRFLHLPRLLDPDRLYRDLHELLHRNGGRQGEWRVRLTVGERDNDSLCVLATAHPYHAANPSTPFSLWLPPSLPPLPLPMVKSLSWSWQRTLLRRARERGMDDVILRGPTGEITETATAAILLRIGSTWRVPSRQGRLDSVGLRLLRAALRSRGQVGIEQELREEDLREADTVWITNALRVVQPVHRINDVAVPQPRENEARELRRWILRTLPPLDPCPPFHSSPSDGIIPDWSFS